LSNLLKIIKDHSSHHAKSSFGNEKTQSTSGFYSLWSGINLLDTISGKINQEISNDTEYSNVIGRKHIESDTFASAVVRERSKMNSCYLFFKSNEKSSIHSSPQTKNLKHKIGSASNL
jgi:hypothetical protein